MRAPSRFLAVATLALAAAAPLAAQDRTPSAAGAVRDVPAPHVRVWAKRAKMRGQQFRLVESRDSVLHVYGPMDFALEPRPGLHVVARADVERVEAVGSSRGRVATAGRRGLGGAMLGTLVGLGVGAIIASDGGMAGLALLFGPPIGFVAGLGLGGVAGAAAPARAHATVYDARDPGGWPALAALVESARRGAGSPAARATTAGGGAIAQRPDSAAVARPGAADASTGARRLAPGTVVRALVPQWDRETHERVVAWQAADTLYVRREAGSLAATPLPLSTVERLEVRARYRSRGDNMGIGAIAGMFGGAALGAVVDVARGGDEAANDMMNPWDRAGRGAAQGAVAGLFVGTLIGAMRPTSRWREVRVEELHVGQGEARLELGARF